MTDNETPSWRAGSPAAAEGRAAVEAVVSHVFQQHPSLARQAGWHTADGCVPSSTARPGTELDRLHDMVAGSLRTLSVTDDRAAGDDAAVPADPELRADLSAALHMVETEQFQMTALGQLHLTPPEVLAETDLSLYLSAYAPEPERIAALEAHLAALPGFIAEATRTLPARLPAGDRLRSLEGAKAQAGHLTTVTGRLFPGQSAAARARRDLAAAAAAACEAYGRAIAGTRPAAQLYGPDRLAEFLRIVEGIERPARELLDQARAEVATAQAGLDTLARQLGAADRREAVALLAEQVGLDAEETFAGIIQRVREFWTRVDVVSTDTVTPLEIGHAEGPSSAATVEFRVSAPLEPVRPPHLLLLPEPPTEPGAPPSALRRQFLNDAMLEVLAVHEAYPGHYVHAEAAARGGSVIRTCFPWIDALSEGWAHYAEELAVEHGLAEGRPLLRVAQLRSALESAARMVAFLSMHLKQASFAAAVSEAVDSCGWSEERAAREILAVTSNPQGAMYTMGKLTIRDLRDDLGVKSVPELKQLHDQLLRCGTAPLS
ncbi:MAG: DUF885 family protein, partial [Micromonosporaceae bacterium]